MLRLSDSWIWDFWLADTGSEYHLFFLRASRALLDPDRRHLRASVGHAVSTDLCAWELLPDALVTGDAPAFDDVATWTGSVLLGPGGVWHMFYTGAGSKDGAKVQRIGLAQSRDLVTWQKYAGNPILATDHRWYERYGDSNWHDEAWRDPWVFADPDGDGWHMLLTARSNLGPSNERGVVGHARSRDLLTWEAQPPLSQPGTGFGQLEVLQVEIVEGRPVLLFSCMRPEFGEARANSAATGGVWSVPADNVCGPFDIRRATPLTDDRFYSGRLARDRQGQAVLLAFRNLDRDTRFVGELSDPMPVAWQDGQLVVQELNSAASVGALATLEDAG